MSVVLRDAVARRPMTMVDLDTVMALEQRVYPFPWTRGNVSDSLRDGHRAEIVHDAHGALLAYAIAMPVADEVHLLNLTVAPERQGQGLGSALLEDLCAWASEGGMASVWLEVRESNTRARDLYERRGFRAVGRRRGYYPAPEGTREDAIVMQRDLPSSMARAGNT